VVEEEEAPGPIEAVAELGLITAAAEEELGLITEPLG